MKIQEFAYSKNLSNNAIYKAIRREGYSAKELTDKRGNITSAGFKILRRIYPEESEEPQRDPEREKAGIQEQLSESEKGRELLEKELESLREQLAESKKQQAESRERAEKYEKMYIEQQEKASQERAEMLQQLKASQLLLAQQQEINGRLLMNPIKRLFSGRKKNRENIVEM